MKKLADLSADELRGIVAKPHKGLTVRDYAGSAGYMIVVACVYKLFISSFFQNASPEAWFTQVYFVPMLHCAVMHVRASALTELMRRKIEVEA